MDYKVWISPFQPLTGPRARLFQTPEYCFPGPSNPKQMHNKYVECLPTRHRACRNAQHARFRVISNVDPGILLFCLSEPQKKRITDLDCSPPHSTGLCSAERKCTVLGNRVVFDTPWQNAPLRLSSRLDPQKHRANLGSPLPPLGTGLCSAEGNTRPVLGTSLFRLRPMSWQKAPRGLRGSRGCQNRRPRGRPLI